MQKNKKLLIPVTILVAAMLLMAGTFAWTQMVNKVNEFIGTKSPGEDIILHDDFDPITGNKDVYVENPNNVDVFVRIKLNEAMNLTSNTWRPGNSDWQTHTPTDKNCADCGHFNSANKKFHDYFTWTLGGWKYYKPADGSSSVVTDNNIYNGSEPGVYPTPDAQIMTMADYMKTTDAFAKTFYGWIYDTDGYAYWSQPLKQNEVTGLLLNKVTISPSLNDTDYYYAIDVILEAVDIKDIPMWTQRAPASDGSGKLYDKATDLGIQAINYIVGLSESSRSRSFAVQSQETTAIIEEDGNETAEDTEIANNAEDKNTNTDESAESKPDENADAEINVEITDGEDETALNGSDESTL